MALTASQIFDAVAPAYALNAAKATFLELAALRVDATAWGTKYDYAVALVAAHLITLANDVAFSGAGGAGAITGKREGSLGITYAQNNNANADDSDYSLTKYGKQYLGLRKGTIIAAGVTGEYANG